MTPDDHTLSGYNFLIIEDETLQAYVIGDMLDSMGGIVKKMAFTYDQARNAVDEVPFDCAILDINLGGTLSFRIADLLRLRGTPFIICTAYGDAVDIHPSALRTPRLDKPVEKDELREAVLEALEVRH